MAAMDSDDVEVRCKACGKVMGTATLRSESAHSLGKMKWILTRLQCRYCETARVPA